MAKQFVCCPQMVSVCLTILWGWRSKVEEDQVFIKIVVSLPNWLHKSKTLIKPTFCYSQTEFKIKFFMHSSLHIFLYWNYLITLLPIILFVTSSLSPAWSSCVGWGELKSDLCLVKPVCLSSEQACFQKDGLNIKNGCLAFPYFPGNTASK